MSEALRLPHITHATAIRHTDVMNYLNLKGAFSETLLRLTFISGFYEWVGPVGVLFLDLIHHLKGRYLSLVLGT